MRWVALLLLLANLAAGAYLLLPVSTSRGAADLRALELNADKLKRVGAPALGHAPVVKAGACLEWGPFTTVELQRAQEELSKLKITNANAREVDSPAPWWVYIPPAKSREDADRRVRDLEELGIADARVMTAEGDRNAVSLGIFRSEEAAVAYQARMRASKVRNTAIAQRPGLLRLSVIVIAEPTSALVARLAELNAAASGIGLKAVACAAADG